MNDLSFYETGYKGVVVGEAEELLLDAVSGLKSVYIAEKSGAGGILEAMANDAGFHSFISGSSKIIQFPEHLIRLHLNLTLHTIIGWSSLPGGLFCISLLPVSYCVGFNNNIIFY